MILLNRQIWSEPHASQLRRTGSASKRGPDERQWLQNKGDANWHDNERSSTVCVALWWNGRPSVNIQAAWSPRVQWSEVDATCQHCCVQGRVMSTLPQAAEAHCVTEENLLQQSFLTDRSFPAPQFSTTCSLMTVGKLRNSRPFHPIPAHTNKFRKSSIPYFWDNYT